ncbi:hypothetical protein [Coralloluteibacterium thermophilus]|uniref:Uncharacterized protein n=1 Tax=Coralloluteibacterium thermophilum TaxID=2707049 RepID=A0ABV9NQ55_9GAMM
MATAVRPRTLLLAATLALPAARPAPAVPPAPPVSTDPAGLPVCTAWRDAGGVLALGRVALGTRQRALPAEWPRTPGCTDRGSACEVRDPQGLAYVVERGRIGRIEARRADALGAVLPLGLAFGEERGTVARRLAAIPEAGPRAQLLAQAAGAHGPRWASDFCVIHGNAAPASWYVGFDAAGRLETVGLRLDPAQRTEPRP